MDVMDAMGGIIQPRRRENKTREQEKRRTGQEKRAKEETSVRTVIKLKGSTVLSSPHPSKYQPYRPP